MEATTFAAETFAERAAGHRPSRLRAGLASAAVGVGIAVLTYRILRSGRDEP